MTIKIADTKTIKTFKANGKTFSFIRNIQDFGADWAAENDLPRYFEDEINTMVFKGKKQIGTIKPCVGQLEGYVWLHIPGHGEVVLNDFDHCVEWLSVPSEDLANL